jgi:hypothetical protein
MGWGCRDPRIHPCNNALAVGDQFVFSEPLECERVVLDGAVPGEEVQQVVAVAAQGTGARSSRARLARKAVIQPGSAEAVAGAASIARDVISHVSTPVYRVQYTYANSNMRPVWFAFHDCTQQTPSP